MSGLNVQRAPSVFNYSAGYVAFADGAQGLIGDTGFQWDNAAKKLAVSNLKVTTLTSSGAFLYVNSATGDIAATVAPTNGQLLIGSSAAPPVLAALTGTANQVTVTNGAGSITLSLPQNVNAGASPTFVGLTLTGLTANSFLYSGAGGALSTTVAPTNGQLLIGSTGVAPVVASLAGTANQVTVTSGAGSLTLSLPQSIHTGATPQFSALGLGVVAGAAGTLTATTAILDSLTPKTTNVTLTTGALVLPAGSTTVPTLVGTGSLTTGLAWPVASALSFIVNGAEQMRMDTNGTGALNLGLLALAFGPSFGSDDVFIRRDGANALAQRNGTSGQTFYIYGTTDAGLINYERFAIIYTGTTVDLIQQKGGTGLNRALRLGVNGAVNWQVDAGSNFTPTTTNIYSLGTSGSRPLQIFAGSSGIDITSQAYIGAASGGRIAFRTTADNAYGIVSDLSGVSFAGTLGAMRHAELTSTFAPGLGSGSYAMLHLNPTINGTSSGTATALAIASKTNTLTGGSIYLLDVGTTTTDYFTGYTSVFRVATSGEITVAGSAQRIVSGSTILTLSGGPGFLFGSGGANWWNINLNGHFVAVTHNTYDIGATASASPRSIYVGTSVQPSSNGVPTLGAAATGWKGLYLDYTNTAPGTTGNQTINKPAGRVNIAAAGTTVTVTNSLVTAASEVFAMAVTNDSTARVANVVPAAGSFVINLTAAATAETAIEFVVINTN